MGSEPFIFPLVLLGIACMAALAFFTCRARGRTWATIFLFASSAFAIWGARGAARWDHTITIFFMAFGFITLAIFIPLALASLLFPTVRAKLLSFAKTIRQGLYP